MRPLFPGYIFVSFDPKQHGWRSINGTRGVRRLLMLDSVTPQPLPMSAFEEIRSRCSGSEVVDDLLDLRPGTSAKILTGPFADREVRIEALDDRERVRVLLELLGREAVITVSSGCLGPVG